METTAYRGRIAPTPTGRLHLGHARTFAIAWQRCRATGGTMIYRDEDLDPGRCRSEFAHAAMADLRWLGLDWDEGPDAGGPYGPYRQSQRLDLYRRAWRTLRDAGLVYPCRRSRKELRAYSDEHGDRSAGIDDEQDAEPLFPATWRPPADVEAPTQPGSVNWRFRVPEGRRIAFDDRGAGPKHYVAGADFGDFLVWRKDGVPSYELAVVVDDIAMSVTEVVRGQDLLRSTARQWLIYEALGAKPPAFFHADLVRDERGRRLAKRADSLSIAALRCSRTRDDILREAGVDPSSRNVDRGLAPKDPDR